MTTRRKAELGTTRPIVKAMAFTTAAAEATPRDAPQMELDAIFGLVADDFARLNELIPKQLSSGVEMVEEIGRYIVEGGGKRLRPLIVLLTARACAYRGGDHIRLATIIEFLHTATLLHDDVVDNSSRRRGRATANALWGNAPSVLVGDFLYSRGFQLMVELDSMDIMAIISDATNLIAEGEVMQLANIGRTSMTEAEYLEVVRRKTAMLFQAAAPHRRRALFGRPRPHRCHATLRDSTSAWPTNSSTTGSTTPATATSWARTPATTSRKARLPCP